MPGPSDDTFIQLREVQLRGCFLSRLSRPPPTMNKKTDIPIHKNGWHVHSNYKARTRFGIYGATLTLHI